MVVYALVCQVSLDAQTLKLISNCPATNFAISIPSGGISTFGPLIIKSFGYDSFTTILFNMPFGAIQIIATLGGAWVATVMKLKAPILMFLSIPPIIGCVILLTLSHTPDHKGALLVGYYLVSRLTSTITLYRLTYYYLDLSISRN